MAEITPFESLYELHSKNELEKKLTNNLNKDMTSKVMDSII